MSWSHPKVTWTEVRGNLGQLLQVLALAHSSAVADWQIQDMQEAATWSEYYRQVPAYSRFRVGVTKSESRFRFGQQPMTLIGNCYASWCKKLGSSFWGFLRVLLAVCNPPPLIEKQTSTGLISYSPNLLYLEEQSTFAKLFSSTPQRPQSYGTTLEIL